MAEIDTDICVIGAGSAGLSVAAGAARLGVRVVLVEKGKMGGDCLNYGCVPSKALIAAAHAADAMRRSGRFGVAGAMPTIDEDRVHAHVHGVIADIAPHDSQERFERLGVTVIRAAARFTAGDRVVAGGTGIRARRFVVATGSRPAVPPVEGLAEVPFLTNESLFDLTRRPEHLVVLGGGPVGCEMAQAHRRLGSAVTLLQRRTILPRDEPEAVEVVRRRLREDGVGLLEEASVERVTRRGGAYELSVRMADGERTVRGSDLLVATGRAPAVGDLGLEQAGIDYTERGVVVDRRLRTRNRKVFAIGDVVGRQQFTHMAGHHAGIVIRNALFRLPAKVEERAVPWVTYTDPELARVGLSEAEARDRHASVRVLSASFQDNDRARTGRDADGLIKVVVGRAGRVLGASIAGPHAGELILPWVLAAAGKLRIGSLASCIVPYPTLSEISKTAAGRYYEPTLFGPRARAIVRLLLRLG